MGGLAEDRRPMEGSEGSHTRAPVSLNLVISPRAHAIYGLAGCEQTLWRDCARYVKLATSRSSHIRMEVVMNQRDIRVENPQEALFLEQALAMYREMRRTAAAAPAGQVIAATEHIALARGRELIPQSLENVLQDEAQAVEKKGAPSELVRAVGMANIAVGKNARSSQRPAK